jgi:hypothetical protein
MLLERWILKVAVGSLVSGTLLHRAKPLKWTPSQAWIQVLFGTALPSGLGLCVVKREMKLHRGSGLAVLSLDGEVAGTIFDFLGIWFIVMPDMITGLGIKEATSGDILPFLARPEEIKIKNARGQWTIRLEWNGNGSGRGLLLSEETGPRPSS